MNSLPFFAPTSRAQEVVGAFGRSRVLTRAAVLPEPLFSLRRRRALCIGFLLVWPAFYAGRVHSAPLANPDVAPMTLRIGKSVSLPLASGAKWNVEEGFATARIEEQIGALMVRGTSVGTLRLRVQQDDGSVERMAFRFVAPNPAPANGTSASTTPALPPSTVIALAPKRPTLLANNIPFPRVDNSRVSPATKQLVSRRAQSQMTPVPPVDPLSQIPPIPTQSNNTSAPTSSSPASGSPAIGVNPATAPAGFPNGGARINPPAGFPNGLPSFSQTLPAPAVPSRGSIVTSPPDSAPAGTPSLPELPPVAPVPTRPNTPPRPTPATTTRPATARPQTSTPLAPSGPQVVRPLAPAPPANSSRTTRISPMLPLPSRTTNANVAYRPTPRLPRNVAVNGPRPGIEVTQGLARLVSFPDNILSVFFSDPNVMDARAINARTIAVTGTGAGDSTLAVFTSRYPGDAVGRANVYRVRTGARNGSSQGGLSRDPQVIQAAITAALGDPRVRSSVVRLPDGSLAARLTGTVRNTAEVEGATTTAAFYVNRVLSSLYADPTAPTIDAVLSGTSGSTPELALQSNLRRLTGNATLELVSLPGGMALKAVAESPEEAEAILRVLPTLGQPVLPFIVLRGQSNTQNPYYQTQALQGEDRVLTERLQTVTGVTTVTAVRASPNSVAIYGTVQTRGEYEAVKRYGSILAQAAQGTLRPSGVELALPNYDPAGGYLRSLGVQMFVRILDPAQATIRNVTVETSVVEISRTALQNLGAQYGTAGLTNETTGNGVTTRTITPSINVGQALAGNGFIGQGGLGFIDPFRVQLNALAQRGDARVLSRPNVRTVEGMPAQITIGGERPVPSAVAVGGGGGGAVGQSVEFRRFGVIISMRPTVSDDNTILLQIRADITQPDRTFEINLNGALIPGESVRSIDTNIAVRPGDVIIMGGLMTNEKRQQTTKVPILGDLPIIGALFKSKRFENNETELAIFMQPRIDSLPATMTTKIIGETAPSFPSLPSRQEGNGILFQSTTRSP